MSRAAGRTCRVLVFGLVVLIVGFAIAWLGGHGYISIQPQFVTGVTLILFSIVFCLAVTTMMAGTSFIARQNRSTIPDSPKEGVMSRVIRNPDTGTEKIIQAHPNSSIREILEDDWPFSRKKSGYWYVVDARGNDVTNWPISNWDGVAIIRFRD